jgi:hypothetical protein
MKRRIGEQIKGKGNKILFDSCICHHHLVKMSSI